MKAGRKRIHSRPPADPLLVPRVKKYLADNVDKTYVDVALMARALRDRYREYNTKPENAFYQNVEMAYNVVLHSYGLDEPSSGDSDDSDDLELLDDEVDRDREPDDRLGQMYRTSKKRNTAVSPVNDKEDNELIDISSDDGSDDASKSTHPADDRSVMGEGPRRPSLLPTPPVQTMLAVPPAEEGQSDGERPRKRRTAKRASPGSHKSLGRPASDLDRSKHASKVTFDDVGCDAIVAEKICDLVLHMKHPEVYAALGIKAPRGALLHGPPGCGKTLLANAIASKLSLPIISCIGTELVGGMSGESEKLIRDVFEKAVALSPSVLFIDEVDSICGNRVNAQKDMERRMVAQLLSSIDALNDDGARVLLLAATNSPDSLDPGLRRAGRLEQEIALGIPKESARRDILEILCRRLNLDSDVDLRVLAQLTPGFVGADLQALVNKSCTLAIKRVFQYLKENPQPVVVQTVVEVVKAAPEEEIRNVVVAENLNGGIALNQSDKLPNMSVNSLPILDVVDPKEQNGTVDVNSVKASSEVNVDKNSVENNCPENVEENVTIECSSLQDDLQKYIDSEHPFTPEQLSNMKIAQDDFVKALKSVKPCALREGFATVPDVTWDDIGSLSDVRRDLQLAILAPVQYPSQLESLGLSIPSGVLLCGPPGCGKTLLAKAIANEAGINFISVKGPELLNMYVGESERAVRTCFQRAKNSAPCVIFFDEFDSLCPKRLNNDIGGATRVVNQLLTEMDGVESREGVFVLAATNRPDIIDPAALRPGRLDRIIFVGMPLFRDRVDILKAITKKGERPRLSPDVDLEVIAKATEGYTGADLAGLVRQAATQALTDFVLGNLQSEPITVTANHFQIALLKLKPSVSPKEQQHYDKLRLKYSSVGDEKHDIEMDTAESMDTV